MGRARLCIKREAWDAIWRHAKSAYPREAVGALVGKDGCVEFAWPLPNVHPRPEVGYRAEPKALLSALKRAEREGLSVLAFYHSHPQGLALPSETDRREAYWDLPYLIVGLQEGKARAWRLPSGEEVVVVVEPE